MNQSDLTSETNVSQNLNSTVTSEKRQIMDYLFDNQERMGSEIHNKLAKLVAKKEEVDHR